MTNKIKMKTESRLYRYKQENLYWKSMFLEKKWYRKIYGGKWRFIKFGKDTPYIGMFCSWTKATDDELGDSYKETLSEEIYNYTGVDTKWKLYKGIAASMFKYIKDKISNIFFYLNKN